MKSLCCGCQLEVKNPNSYICSSCGRIIPEEELVPENIIKVRNEIEAFEIESEDFPEGFPEDDFEQDGEEPDYFEQDRGGTGHGDDSYSDADSGL